MNRIEFQKSALIPCFSYRCYTFKNISKSYSRILASILGKALKSALLHACNCPSPQIIVLLGICLLSGCCLHTSVFRVLRIILFIMRFTSLLPSHKFMGERLFLFTSGLKQQCVVLPWPSAGEKRPVCWLCCHADSARLNNVAHALMISLAQEKSYSLAFFPFFFKAERAVSLLCFLFIQDEEEKLKGTKNIGGSQSSVLSQLDADLVETSNKCGV